MSEKPEECCQRAYPHIHARDEHGEYVAADIFFRSAAPVSLPSFLSSLSFEDLRAANLARLAQAWPAEDPWAPWDWTNALSGEAGELCTEVLILCAALV